MTAAKLRPGELAIQERQQDAVTILELAGELDMATTSSLTVALDGVHRNGAGVVLDLAELVFIDSHGLHALLRHAEKDRVVLARPTPNVARIFALTKTNGVLAVCDTLEEALARAGG